MYWYYKYPLLVLLILVLLGFCVLIWRSAISPYLGSPKQPEAVQVQAEQCWACC